MKLKNTETLAHTYLRTSAFLLISLVFITRADAFEPLATPDLDDIVFPDDEEPAESEILLGKMLFFDRRLSINQSQSCATCHNPTLGFSDMQKTSLGANGERLKRNSPPLYNLAWNQVFFWDGRAQSLEQQALGPIESEDEMGMPMRKLLPLLQAIKGYRPLFRAAYGENAITAENLGRAIAAFERTIVSDNSPFDQYLAGDIRAMQPSAIRGMELFKGKAACIECHDGPNFTDESFHNIGLESDDPGRYNVFKDKSLFGAFKTPGLRNVALTAPYMHDGSEATLESVVRFYNRGGDRAAGKSSLITSLDLTEQEIADLISFLGALTDPIEITPPALP